MEQKYRRGLSEQKQNTLTKSPRVEGLSLQRVRLSAIQWWNSTPYSDICSTDYLMNWDFSTLMIGRRTTVKPPRPSNFPPKVADTDRKQGFPSLSTYESPLDILYQRLEMDNPDHIAVKYYKDYRNGAAKTIKSIQITLAARLEKFNLTSLIGLTSTDELDLASLGEKR